MAKDYIITFTGKKVSITNPRPQDVCVEDIAHHLANICRYTGATRSFYSVAQHCVLVSQFCDNPIEGLIHDASEAYLNDLSAPLKHSDALAGYRDLEQCHEAAICAWLNIDSHFHRSVKEADERMYYTEVRDLLPEHVEFTAWYSENARPYDFEIIPLAPTDAEKLFLDRFYHLTR